MSAHRKNRRKEPTPEHRRGKRRKRFSRISLLLQVLGGMSLVIGLLMSGWGFFIKADKVLYGGLVYLAGGLVLLLLRALMKWSKGTRRKRRRRSRRSYLPHESQDGMALVVVLVVIAVIAALLLQAQRMAGQSVRMEDARVTRVQLRTAATDAALAALAVLADDPDLTVDHPAEPWAELMEFSRPGGIDTVVRITDLNRFFDLNNLGLDPPGEEAAGPSAEIIMNIMNLCGDFSPVAKVEALRDWLDEDEEGIREDDFYRRLDPPYEAADDVIRSFKEVLQVDGLPRDVFARKERYEVGRPFSGSLIDGLAVVPVPRARPVPVNLNTAPREVIQGVLGMEYEETVNKLLVLRQNTPLTGYTAVVTLTRNPRMFAKLKDYAGFASHYFYLEAGAFRDRRTEKAHAVVGRDAAGTVEILRWVM